MLEEPGEPYARQGGAGECGESHRQGRPRRGQFLLRPLHRALFRVAELLHQVSLINAAASASAAAATATEPLLAVSPFF